MQAIASILWPFSSVIQWIVHWGCSLAPYQVLRRPLRDQIRHRAAWCGSNVYSGTHNKADRTPLSSKRDAPKLSSAAFRLTFITDCKPK